MPEILRVTGGQLAAGNVIVEIMTHSRGEDAMDLRVRGRFYNSGSRRGDGANL